MKKVLHKISILEQRKEEKDKNRRRKNSCQIYFRLIVSRAFQGKNAAHAIIKKLKIKHNLKWLRVSMSYHKFPNLSKIFSGDLTGKLMKGIKSLDFID